MKKVIGVLLVLGLVVGGISLANTKQSASAFEIVPMSCPGGGGGGGGNDRC